MDRDAARSTERYLMLHALVWATFAAGHALAAPPLRTAPLGTRPAFAVVLVLATLALCAIASRRRTAAPTVRNLPAIAAASLLLLAVESQVVGFHAPRPSSWELAGLAAAAGFVALIGGSIVRKRASAR